MRNKKRKKKMFSISDLWKGEDALRFEVRETVDVVEVDSSGKKFFEGVVCVKERYGRDLEREGIRIRVQKEWGIGGETLIVSIVSKGVLPKSKQVVDVFTIASKEQGHRYMRLSGEKEAYELLKRLHKIYARVN